MKAKLEIQNAFLFIASVTALAGTSVCAVSAENQKSAPVSVQGQSPKKTRVTAKSNKNKSGKLTEEAALKLVSNRPEVKSWKKGVIAASVKRKGVTPHIAIDREENGAYVVHVYEEVPDDAETSHTATMNWYYVNEHTGKVKTEFK